jgi:3',5'-cyclic AMP phosphodiesterase CpdA
VSGTTPADAAGTYRRTSCNTIRAMSERSVTIVHLSDLQFGKFHRFPEDADPSNTFDSLLPRLIADFGYLREQHGVNPDLLVVTGDLAEWGRKSELQQVFTFIAGAARALGLPHNRVVVIPGNHDIDRDACASYFFQCKSRELPPARPYEAKWTHFRTFFEELYRDVPGVAFTDVEPWTLYEFPELHTVIAGLNSTWMDSHLDEDHYGCIGEPQLRWFESKLRERQYAGWLRIAAVHHNVRRAPVRDDENLRDANLFASTLGPLINVVLHGHTHDGKTDVLRKNVPIYSTGSAAVGAGQRPPEVPNQYQVLQITPAGVRRWARAYRADERKFIGDNRASDDGNHWQTHEAFDFSHFAVDEEPMAKPRHLDWQPAMEHRSRPDELIDRIERVCHIRHPGAAQTTLFRSPTDPMPYISLGIQDGPVTTQYPIGATEEPVTREMVLAFASTIQSRYSRDDRSVGSLIVYGGDKAPDETLQREAQRLGITLQSWVQFQGLIPFGDYVETQRRQLQRDPRYVSHLFVPQKIRYTTPAGEAVEHDNALEAMLDMLTEPEGRFIVILGEFGTGKSFLQRQIALRLSELPRPQPILIEMRTLEKAHDFDQLIAQHLVRHGFPSLNLRAFRYMLEQGRLALLFDGFDELAMRVSYDRAAEHLQTLIQAAAGNAKIVVTSRTEYFESDQQVKTALAEKLEVIGGRRLVHLQRFDRPRIVQYLTRQLGSPEAAAERMKLLEDVEDLSGLSENARMLTFISSLDEEQLRKARTREGRVTRSSIYRTLVVDKWLAFEEERLSPRGSAPPLSKEERLEAVIVLARHMWGRPDATVKLSELSERIAGVVGRLPRIDASSATHQVASGTLLVRDADGNFSFVHRSILEWIIAIDAASEIRAGRTPEALMVNDISPLVADFIGEEVEGGALAEWLRATTASAETDSMLRRNALVLIGRLSGTDRVTIDATTSMQLSGADLRGRDFSNSSMQQANLEGADLTDTRFINTDLRGANLRKAILRGADLTNANLAGADLSDVDLSRALLPNTSLREARLTGASLYRANLLNADLRDAALDGADLTGAAGTPQAREIRPLFEDGLTPIALAFSPRGDLLAALHRRSIRLFDIEAGRELGTYLVPLDCTLSCVAWSGDGQHLLAGTAEGQALLWDLGSALPRWGVKVHDTPVLTLGETGATVVVVTTAVVKTLQKTSGKFGRASFTLPVPAVAADVESLTGGVVVALEDGRLAEIFRRELLVWGPRWSATDYLGVIVSAAARIAAFATSAGLHVVSPEETLVTTRLRAVSGSLAVAGDGSRVAFQDRQGITIISVASATIQEIPVRRASWLALDQGGGRLACFDDNEKLAIIDTTTHFELPRFSIPAGRLFTLRMESDYELQVMTADGAWHSLDIKQGQLREVSKPINGAIRARYPWKNAVQHVMPGKNQIQVMDTRTAKKRIVSDKPSRSEEAAIGDDGTVAYSDNREVRLLPPKGGEHKVNIADARFLRFDANCSLLFVVDRSDRLSIVNVKTGHREHTQQLAQNVSDVSVSRSEIALLMGRKAVILRLPDLEEIAEVPIQGRPESLAYSASGALLAIVGRASLTIRDTATGVVRNAPLAIRSYFRAAFSPSERSVACATLGGAIDLFDVQSLELKVSAGFLTPKTWVVFRPDGRFKAAGDLQARFAHAIGLCRFGPGELDSWLDKPLRVPDDQPLFETF